MLLPLGTQQFFSRRQEEPKEAGAVTGAEVALWAGMAHAEYCCGFHSPAFLCVSTQFSSSGPWSQENAVFALTTQASGATSLSLGCLPYQLVLNHMPSLPGRQLQRVGVSVVCPHCICCCQSWLGTEQVVKRDP